MVAEVRRLDRRSAGELRTVERQVSHLEETEAWREARKAARVIRYAVVAERPDISLHMAGQIVGLADRRLRQLGDDAA